MSLSKIINQPLPYFEDSARLFAPLAGKPWAVFLDSGYPVSRQGCFDIMAADPVCTLVTHGNVTKIKRGVVVSESTDDPFELVKIGRAHV